VTGGVAFATPDGDPLAPLAPEGFLFPLAADPDKDAGKWAPKIPIQSPETVLHSTLPPGVAPGLLKH